MSEADWMEVRATNAIEPAFREMRRRTRPMSCFNNAASIERILFAVFYYENLKHGVSAPSESTQGT